ncbi:DUF6516 family protein [Phormidium sp. FACHB-1136]|uniref:toxin-antitoxin system TumE family protein n=1 Tax=Phormidium sp. FACHB-1136 TaxID=2692848 RepID=UPI001687AE66|nr:DUF6516 family protein [Phormidium sp. FACHB-1136]MBD2428131.1 hypothetical protein [Phormidium sp. FACHB-1136]
MEAPLRSLDSYSRFISKILDRDDIEKTTITVWSNSPYSGTAEGEVFFKDGLRLRMREELDFDAGLITSYGYEVYKNETRLYWYDDFPHPNDASLASTFPHHKHIPPNIKRNRIPAPNIDFNHPNLPFILQEIDEIRHQT